MASSSAAASGSSAPVKSTYQVNSARHAAHRTQIGSPASQTGKGASPWAPVSPTRISWTGRGPFRLLERTAEPSQRAIPPCHPDEGRISSPQRVSPTNPTSIPARMWSRYLASIVIGLVLLATVVLAAAAQATPGIPNADSALCTVAPRTLDDLERIMAGATPVPSRDRPISGDAIDPDSETGRQVTSVIEALVACLDAGDRLRAYALYTDAYLASIL